MLPSPFLSKTSLVALEVGNVAVLLFWRYRMSSGQVRTMREAPDEDADILTSSIISSVGNN
jgi:hypothetical protein